MLQWSSDRQKNGSMVQWTPWDTMGHHGTPTSWNILKILEISWINLMLVKHLKTLTWISWHIWHLSCHACTTSSISSFRVMLLLTSGFSQWECEMCASAGHNQAILAVLGHPDRDYDTMKQMPTSWMASTCFDVILKPQSWQSQPPLSRTWCWHAKECARQVTTACKKVLFRSPQPQKWQYHYSGTAIGTTGM